MVMVRNKIPRHASIPFVSHTAVQGRESDVANAELRTRLATRHSASMCCRA